MRVRDKQGAKRINVPKIDKVAIQCHCLWECCPWPPSMEKTCPTCWRDDARSLVRYGFTASLQAFNDPSWQPSPVSEDNNARSWLQGFNIVPLPQCQRPELPAGKNLYEMHGSRVAGGSYSHSVRTKHIGCYCYLEHIIQRDRLQNLCSEHIWGLR